MSQHGITVIGESALPAKFWAENFYRNASPELTAEFKAYNKANGIYYYARPREDFHSWEAYELAKAAGCSKLLMEDMS
jgi:hypothetical protein